MNKKSTKFNRLLIQSLKVEEIFNDLIRQAIQEEVEKSTNNNNTTLIPILEVSVISDKEKE